MREITKWITLGLLRPPDWPGDVSAKPILKAYFNSQGVLDSIEVNPLPIRPLTGGLLTASSPEELIEKHVGQVGIDRAFLENFTEQGLTHVLGEEDTQQAVSYGQSFNLLERGFRVEHNSGLVTVQQRLLTPGAFPSYSATLPLSILQGKVIALRSEGKTWRNFFDEIGVKAQSVSI